MSRNPRPDRGERGIAIVMVALLLVVFMIFAAFAVDVGALVAARREDQNGADAGSLAAAQDLGNADAALVLSVKTHVHDTIGETFTDAQWDSCGTASTTGDPDFVDTIVAGVSCITVDGTPATRRQVQVRVPTQQYNTAFGHIVGLNSFSHSAFAIAGVESGGVGPVLPYGVPSGSASNTQGCLKSPTSPHTEYPCDGPSSGAFGFLDFTYFGSRIENTVQTCSGDENGRISRNTALGIDHDLQTHGTPPTYSAATLRDDVECGNTENKPNAAQADTGNRVSAFGVGIYSGNDVQGPNDTASWDARLSQPTPGISWDTPRTVDGYPIDNVPLWEFIAPVDVDNNGLSVPDSCTKSIFTDALSGVYTQLPTSPANVRSFISTRSTQAERLRWLLDRCITHYRGVAWNPQGSFSPNADPTSCPNTGCTDPVFARDTDLNDGGVYDIQYTPRFGYVPQLTTNWGSPAETPQTYYIGQFRAVYIQRLFANCTAAACDLDVEPGVAVVGGDAPSNGNAEGMTVYLFPAHILPNGLADDNAPARIGVNRFIRLVR